MAFARGCAAGSPSLPCQEERKFPTNTACLVSVQWVESSRSLWVVMNGEINTLENVSRYLSNYPTVGNDRVPSLAVNDVVSAMFPEDGAWYRAKVLKTEPLVVQFIDFGNVCSVTEVEPLPHELTLIHPLAINVKLAYKLDPTPEIEDELLVNYITSENGIAVVSASTTSEAPNADSDTPHNANLISDSAKVTSPESTIQQTLEPRNKDEITRKEISDVPHEFGDGKISDRTVSEANSESAEAEISDETISEANSVSAETEVLLSKTISATSNEDGAARDNSSELITGALNAEDLRSVAPAESPCCNTPLGVAPLVTEENSTAKPLETAPSFVPVEVVLPSSPSETSQPVFSVDADEQISAVSEILSATTRVPIVGTLSSNNTLVESISAVSEVPTETTESIEEITPELTSDATETVDMSCIMSTELPNIDSIPLPSDIGLQARPCVLGELSELTATTEPVSDSSSSKPILPEQTVHLPGLTFVVNEDSLVAKELSSTEVPDILGTCIVPSNPITLPATPKEVLADVYIDCIEVLTKSVPQDVSTEIVVPTSETISAIPEEALIEVAPSAPRDVASEFNTSALKAEEMRSPMPTESPDFDTLLPSDAAEHTEPATGETLSDASRDEIVPTISKEALIKHGVAEGKSTATISDKRSDGPGSKASRNITPVTADTSMAVDVSSSMSTVSKSDRSLNVTAKVFKMSSATAPVSHPNPKERSPRPLYYDILKKKSESTKDSFLHAPMSENSEFPNNMEFELSIIREQNRIQMLQLQAKMEQELFRQINSVKQEMSRQLSTVGHKLANIYADMSLLKNDLERTKYSQSSVPGGMPNMNSMQFQNPNLFSNIQTFNHESAGGLTNATHYEYGKDMNNQVNMQTSCFIQQSEQQFPNSSSKELCSNKPDDSHGSTTASRKSKGPNNIKSSSKCVFVRNLPENVTPDHLHNLFGVYGMINKIKMMPPRKASIEMGDNAQAAMAIHYLQNIPLMGSKLQVSADKFQSLTLSPEDLEENLGKNYTGKYCQKIQRFLPPQWDANKLPAPCHHLIVHNLSKSMSDDQIQAAFEKEGFKIRIRTISRHDDKKTGFIHCHSLEEAVNILTVMHLAELVDWMKIRVCFCPPKNN